ncbi:precorrin-8X methylmutase [Salinisphaera orenii MK-B5]|uniref:Precorrin-8X methylmutase n=2 Tax=Salinisphaera orenii TaxID=856731 RepID=A0A423PKR8_9GAMM|nr:MULTISPECIES: precorrin-8X methylmutase [Salinisphaera]ROO23863.1 precorrin-8X methylmutase [Salinisphaera halophila YIM 95161]ROO26195.1 precorrin-8X methylmutase [Salinisphaera orenii MK-B5]
MSEQHVDYDYIRDGRAIYEKSFAIIEAEADLDGLAPDLRNVAIRMIHACGQTDLAADLRHSAGVAAAARTALQAGAPILCDSEMVAHGVTRRRLPADNAVVCTLRDPDTPTLARSIGNTRTAAALELWGDNLDGAVVAIGNAPTALFHLLELIAAGAPRPAAVIGLPVGFVGAIESKEALAAQALGLDYLTLFGRRGGSAMAAAAVNALASEAL